MEILDRYLYYFENDNPAIQPRAISALISLINEQFSADGQTSGIQTHYQNTLQYIRLRKSKPETAEKYAQIEC